ncbi:MAG: DUF3592 domain-containing protein [Chloroflexota bacterium]
MNSSLFLLQPAHAGFLNNTSRKLYGSSMRQVILIFILALFCLALGGGMTYYAMNEQTVQAALAKDGVKALATVTDGEKTTGRTTTYSLTYNYDANVNGQVQSFSNSQEVSSMLYDSTAIGAHVSIRYLPDDPATSRILGESTENTFLVILGIAFSLGSIYLIFYFVRQYRRDRTLERAGQIITGTITKSSISGVGGKRQVTVQYTFTSPLLTLGEESHGKQSERRRDVQLTDVPPGTKVAVVYFDDKTFRLL